MAKYDANFGARKMERRRFRQFLMLTLPMLAALGYLLAKNPPELLKAQTNEPRAAFTDAVREILEAFRVAYSLKFDEDGRPVPPPYIE